MRSSIVNRIKRVLDSHEIIFLETFFDSKMLEKLQTKNNPKDEFEAIIFLPESEERKVKADYVHGRISRNPTTTNLS